VADKAKLDIFDNVVLELVSRALAIDKMLSEYVERKHLEIVLRVFGRNLCKVFFEIQDLGNLF
jgi:hypothetical protein